MQRGQNREITVTVGASAGGTNFEFSHSASQIVHNRISSTVLGKLLSKITKVRLRLEMLILIIRVSQQRSLLLKIIIGILIAAFISRNRRYYQ